MFESTCKECGNHIFLDILSTAMSYNNETTILIDTEGNPTIENLPNYAILDCPRCGNREKKTFDELIALLKEVILKSMLTTRQVDSYEGIDKSKLREESGMSYCGMCPGPFDADGYCLNDLQKQCIIRKAHSD